MVLTNLTALLDERVDWRFKGFPPAEGVTFGTVGEQGWNLIAGDLPLPALVLKERALAHNVELVARWCAEHGVLHAPHGKTMMAPQLAERQLAAGAWAVTVAHVSQARVYRAFGVPRIFLANELVEPGSLRWLADELAADPDFDFYCLVDSLAGVELMTGALAGRRAARKGARRSGLRSGSDRLPLDRGRARGRARRGRLSDARACRGRGLRGPYRRRPQRRVAGCGRRLPAARARRRA